MRAILIVTIFLAACVPTTRYAYVPASPEAVEIAKTGTAIPLVQNSIALCFPDGSTELVREAEIVDGKLCAQARVSNMSDDGIECFSFTELAGIGIPYEGRSLSVIPMAAFKIGTCDPNTLIRATPENR